MAQKPQRQSAPSTVDPAEVERFSALAAEWWNPRGKMAPLHKFNPVRIGYIRDQAAVRFARDAKRLDSMKGLRILDIGCGGGILSEPLARLGAEMVGVDPSDTNIAAAKRPGTSRPAGWSRRTLPTPPRRPHGRHRPRA